MPIDFRAVIDAARDAIAVLDRSGTYHFLNPAAFELTGKSAEAVIGRRYEDLWPRLKGSPFDLAFRRVAAGGPRELVEYPSIENDTWIRVDLAPVGADFIRATWYQLSTDQRLEEHLDAAIAAAGLGPWQLDWRSGVFEASERTRQHLALGADEPLTVDTWLDRCEPDDRALLRAALQRTLEGAPFVVEHRLQDGRWLRVTARLVSRDESRPRLSGFTEDITAARRREEHQRFLARSGELLASSLELGPVVHAIANAAIGVLGDICVIDLVEDGTLHRMEVAFDEAVGDPGASALRKLDVAKYGKTHPVRRALDGESVLVSEWTPAMYESVAVGPEHLAAIRKTGARSVICVPLRSGGAVLGVLTFTWRRPTRRHDADDLALAEELARRMALAVDNVRSHRELKQIVEIVQESGDFIGYASLAGFAAFLNRAGLALVGATLEEVVGQPIEQFFVPEDLPAARENVRRALEHGSSVAEVRFRHFRTGAPIPVSWNVFLLRNAKGEPDRLATITRDLTEQKRAGKEREELIAQLQHALKLADLFVGILGHDLRNPLSAVLAGAKLLEKSKEERTTRTAARIRSSGLRMNELIGDLLDFTRIRVGQGIRLERVETDAAELCRNVAAELEQANPDRRIEVHASGQTRGAWDPHRISQAVSNLVGNAVQHGGGAPVRVTVDGASLDGVKVTVFNQGAPIPEQLRAGLFDPFKRAERNREQGLGLGLYIADQIIRVHGGHLTVTSSEAEGTSFTIELPRQPA